MIITFTPTDSERGDPHVWEFDPKRVLSDEAELIERHWGNPWDHFVANAKMGSTAARKLLLWHLMRRDHPGNYVNLKDVPAFYTGEVVVEQGSAELVDMKASIMKRAKTLTADELTDWLALWQVQYDEALEREGRSAPDTIDGELAIEQPAEETRTVPDIPLPDGPSPTFGGAIG